MRLSTHVPALIAVSLAAALSAALPAGGQEVGGFRPRGVAQAKIVLDADALERGRPIKGKLLLGEEALRRADASTIVKFVVFRVSDSLGRLLVEKQLPLPRKPEMPFELELPGVVAMRHTISAATKNLDPPQAAGARVIYMPPKEWDDYVCAIWHRHNPRRIPYLQEMYLSGTQWTGSSSHLPEHFIDANYRYYVETGAAWIFAAYHRWFPDREKTFYHKQAKKAFIADRTNLRVLERNPCLADDHVRERIRWIFTHEARLHRLARPLFYTVADEPGIANQAAPFDYCFAPQSQAAFRAWLKERYKTLAALNAQWGSRHKSWEAVRGATTDETFARTDDNFSAWCDFKEFMDDQLILEGYGLAGKAMRRHDPAGRLGMGGAQGPAAVGGWDFWKLCTVFDVLEAYYIGNNYELMRSFNPELIPFHCSFGAGDPEKHLIWYLFIHGDRGLLVWDEGSKFVDDDGKYSDRAKQARDWYRELTGGIGRLRIASRRTDDPVALYHSQANLRVHWLLEVRPSGKDWIQRDSWSERMASRYFRLRESWVKLIEDNGMQYRFLCPAQVARGDLKPYDPKTGRGFKVLILPEIHALSPAEAEAIRGFVQAGGTVIADRPPGGFDAHGRKRDASPLADLFRHERAVLLDRDMLPYYQQRVFPGDKEGELKRLIGDHLRKALGRDRVTPEVTGEDGRPVTGVEVTVWRNGPAELVAIHRNPLLRIKELGPQEYKSNKKFETPVKLRVSFQRVRRWVDVRTGKALTGGVANTVTLPPFEPVILMALPAVGDERPLEVKVDAGKAHVRPTQPAMAAPVLHLEFLGPDGKQRPVYRRNVVCPPGGGEFPLPLALNDAPGKWTLKVHEVATGARKDVTFRHAR